MQKNKGFTLIELMVTIAVLAIVASFVVPSFSDYLKKYKLKQAEEQVVQSLKEGRSKAAATRALVVVCPSKLKDGGLISSDKCLSNANVATADVATYKDTQRVILANITNGIEISGDTYFVFGPTGASLQSVSSPVPKGKNLVICSANKTKEIAVTVLGNVVLKNSGVC